MSQGVVHGACHSGQSFYGRPVTGAGLLFDSRAKGPVGWPATGRLFKSTSLLRLAGQVEHEFIAAQPARKRLAHQPESTI